MAEVVNLNKARKARNKAEARTRAQGNAVKFGRSKAQKAAETQRAEKAARDLEGHKRQ